MPRFLNFLHGQKGLGSRLCPGTVMVELKSKFVKSLRGFSLGSCKNRRFFDAKINRETFVDVLTGSSSFYQDKSVLLIAMHY